MEETIEVVENKSNLDIFIHEDDKFIISRIYNVSIPVDRVRYLEIIDADQDSSKTDIDKPPFIVVAYTNIEDIEMVPLNEYNNLQDAFTALSEYSRYAFNNRE